MKNKNVESSKLTDSDTVSESVEMLQTQILKTEKRRKTMYVKIQTSNLSNGNTGSCSQLVFYLEKEIPISNKAFLFTIFPKNIQIAFNSSLLEISGDKKFFYRDTLTYCNLFFNAKKEKLFKITHSFCISFFRDME